MKIFLASDHAGFELKEKIKKHLDKRKIKYKDFGTFSKESCDYPDFIIPTIKEVTRNKNNFGIILGGSGQGEAIAANKVKGIRAVVYYQHNLKIVKLSKEHNNANVLSLGARFLTTKEALKAIDLWINTKFSRDKRHVRRLKKIEKFEKKGK